MAASCSAITFLKPGPQTLEGVLVKESVRLIVTPRHGGIAEGSCMETPQRKIVEGPTRYGILISAGSRSEQFVPIKFPAGNTEVPEYLGKHAVERVFPRMSSNYPDSQPLALKGTIEGDYQRGDIAFLVTSIFGPGGEFAARLKRMWKADAQDLEGRPRNAATRALSTLEAVGLLDKMVEDVTRILTSPRPGQSYATRLKQAWRDDARDQKGGARTVATRAIADLESVGLLDRMIEDTTLETP